MGSDTKGPIGVLPFPFLSTSEWGTRSPKLPIFSGPMEGQDPLCSSALSHGYGSGVGFWRMGGPAVAGSQCPAMWSHSALRLGLGFAVSPVYSLCSPISAHLPPPSTKLLVLCCDGSGFPGLRKSSPPATCGTSGLL